MHTLSYYGCARGEELYLMEEMLSRNSIMSDPDISECPGWNSFCKRTDNKDARVFCHLCHNQGKNDNHCWDYKSIWDSASNDKCGNPTCRAAEAISQIQDILLIKIWGIKCPSICLCPHCGTATKHSGGCKQMICK